MITNNSLMWMGICFTITVLLTPILKRIAIHNGWYALENERTVHHGKIPRIGGVAIYVSFMVAMICRETIDARMVGVIVGMTLMFLIGFVDDLFDLTATTKLIFQVISAIILIITGTSVDVIRLPFGIILDFGIISMLFTILWVVGITNAINLIDGLDGLAGGMTSTMLVIIALTALIEGQLEITHMALVMVASIFGFLFYNAHPASIFMGDCGSLTLGFFISAISLMGFKSATVMTLALPVLILFLPILDTVSAIFRRTLKHMKFSSADKQHLHHQLMRRFGQTKTVLIMCGMTACFGLSAYLYMIDKEIGITLMVAIIFVLEIFVERTAMISEKFHPVMSCFYKLKNIVIKK